MSVKHRTAQGAALALALLWSASAQAADPKGIWLDHTGRGAVQIKDCKKGRGLCGFVVYVKQKKYADRCGLQILGNVTKGGGGWIYSPSRGSRYTVRLKRLNSTRLRVVGNASSAFFSKTFTWKKAPADLPLCGKYGAAQRLAAAKKKKADAPKKQFVNELNSANPVVPLSKELDADFDRSTRVTGAEKPASKPPQSEIEEMEASLTSKQNAPAEDENNADVVIDVEEDEAEAGSVKTSGDPMEGKFKAVLGKFLGKGGLKGNCKFRIPYVNRVIRVPCK